MSFWKLDCYKLRSRPEDSADPESSLWTTHSLHAAETTAAGPHNGCRAIRMQRHSIVRGITCSLDETDGQSEGISVQHQAYRRPLTFDDVTSKHAEQHQERRRQLPAEELLLPELSAFTPYSAAVNGQQQSVQCSFDGTDYTVEQQVCLPTVTPPASPAHSEETVGCAPARWMPPSASAAEGTAVSGDPTDISSRWRATKKRRLAGTGDAESQPHARRSLDLVDDAESNMPPPTQLRNRGKWHVMQRKPALSATAHLPEAAMRRPHLSLLSHWESTAAAEHAAFYQTPPAPEQWDESFHPLPHPLDVEE